MTGPRLLIVLAVAGLLAGEAAAQPQAPDRRPVFSSYYSLLRPSVGGYYGSYGGALGAGGYGQEQRDRQLQQQLAATNQNLANLQTLFAYGPNPNLGPTGRPAVFGQLGHWYPAAGGGGGTGMAPRPAAGMAGGGTNRTAGNGVPLR